MSKKNFYKGKFTISLVLFSLIVFATTLRAQNFLEIPVRLDIEKGSYDDVVVKVKKEGKDAFTQSGASKMRFKLDFSKKYSLIFTKPGYITKTIEINTTAPSSRISKGFDPYKIGVKMYKQGEDNAVVYNQPVAKIKFDENLDDFSFETDYSKSILSALNTSDEQSDEETKAVSENKDVKVAATATEPTSTPISSNSNNNSSESGITASTEAGPAASLTNSNASQINYDIPSPPALDQGNDKQVLSTVNSGEDQSKTTTATSGEETNHQSNGINGEDAQKKSSGDSGLENHASQSKVSIGEDIPENHLSAKNDIDIRETQAVNFENEKITREDIIETNRIITKVLVIKGSQSTEYRRVNYKWGGRFFFKDNTKSISENLFVQWTGVNN